MGKKISVSSKHQSGGVIAGEINVGSGAKPPIWERRNFIVGVIAVIIAVISIVIGVIVRG